jgi:hypothetical protein
MLVVFLFNYVTRSYNDYVALTHDKNAAVAMVYASLVLATFYIAADIAGRIVALILKDIQ